MSSLLIYRMQSLLADLILELNCDIQKSFVYVKGIFLLCFVWFLLFLFWVLSRNTRFMKSQICQNLTVLLNPSNICRKQQNYRRKDCGSFSPFMSQTRSKFRFKSCNIFWLKVKANWASAVFLLILFQSGWTQNFTGSKLKQLQLNTQYTSPGLTHLVQVYVTNETSKWYNVSSSSSLNTSIAQLSPNKVSSVSNFNFILPCLHRRWCHYSR